MQMGRSKKKSSSKGQEELTEENFDARLAAFVLSKGLVTSAEESVCLADAMIAEIDESDLERESACIAAFEDYFSMSTSDARALVTPLLGIGKISPDSQSSSEKEPEVANSVEFMDEEDDYGDFIGEGECELCERFIKLTRHHLIPKSTWPRITSRLRSAADALGKNDLNRAGMILGAGLAHLLEPLTVIGDDKKSIKGLLEITCDICRQCHSAIHRTHDNMTLATEFATVDLLLQDEKIFKFAKFASKQKAGKHAR